MNNKLKKLSLAAGAMAVSTGKSGAAEGQAVADLIAGLKDKNDNVRADALQSAAQIGAPAVRPLAEVMADKDVEVMRAGKRALWKIVRHVGRPGADDEKKSVVAELRGVLGDEQPALVRREVLWMLSEIGGSESVESIAPFLPVEEFREDARMVLERIPGRESLDALKEELKAADDDFKLSIAESLRKRGVRIRGLASVKLFPMKKTNVEPLK
jgi:HEAT repeat protein